MRALATERNGKKRKKLQGEAASNRTGVKCVSFSSEVRTLPVLFD